MCGIVGAMAFGPKLVKSDERVRQDSIRYIVTELLQQTKVRGEDATGVATLFRNGIYHLLKMGIDSEKFTTRFGGTETDYDGYLRMWEEAPQPASMFIGHCRKSSVGNSTDNVNNHPIRVKDTIGIHNGTLKNHEQIFKQLKCGRDGVVDSEAIIRLLDVYSNNGETPFTPEMVVEVARRLDGSFSVLAFNGNNPYQMTAFRDGRPMEYVLVRPLNTVFVASEKRFLQLVLHHYNNMARLYQHKSFVPLTSSDVQYGGLKHNGAAVFDLTRTIEKDTRIDDLCDIADIPYQRLWKVGTKPVTSVTHKPSSNNDRHSNTSTAGNTSSGSTAHSVAADKNKKQTPLKGLVWIKALKNYRNISNTEIEEDKKTTAVELCVKECATVGQRPGALTEVDNVETTVTNPVIVKDVSTTSVKTSKQEVDMTVDSSALEEAEKASKELPTLENDEDVLEALEIADIRSLEALPLAALCNRVRRATFKGGFYQGMRRAKELTNKDSGSSAVARKLRRAQAHIRLLKVVVHMFSRMVTSLKKSTTAGSTHNKLQAAAKSAAKLSTTAGLNSGFVNDLFSVGDLRSDENLRALKTAMDFEEE